MIAAVMRTRLAAATDPLGRQQPRTSQQAQYPFATHAHAVLAA
jgi:hypothetical protein